MGKLSFYRQARQDGGVRTAIEVNEDTVLHHFEEGGDESDPSLLWWVDLRCEGPGLPKGAEEARRWLLTHAGSIKEGFGRLAEKLHAGLDVDLYPLQWSDFHGLPKRVKATAVCSAIRRVTARDIATVVRGLAGHWEEIIANLPALPAAATGG